MLLKRQNFITLTAIFFTRGLYISFASKTNMNFHQVFFVFVRTVTPKKYQFRHFCLIWPTSFPQETIDCHSLFERFSLWMTTHSIDFYNSKGLSCRLALHDIHLTNLLLSLTELIHLCFCLKIMFLNFQSKHKNNFDLKWI